MTPQVVIIVGPTASGKTALAEHIAGLPATSLAEAIKKRRRVALATAGEIINADIGQFYTPLSVGTAKTAWRNKPFKCHLFDIIDKPEMLDVRRYRDMVRVTVDDCLKRNKLPIIVGGSLFYIQSLFFSPREQEIQESTTVIDFETDTDTLWHMLNTIDPERAQALHPNDRYRIVRALKIWQTTHEKPSLRKPQYEAPFAIQTRIIALEPPREELAERIQQRTTHMLYQEGWIEEVEKLLDTPWESFVQQRGFIGYTELFAWIRAGKNRDELPTMITAITTKTLQYAKRQITFWHKLQRLLTPHCNATLTIEMFSATGETAISCFK
jgi:tRNA dimethylallyltransferase